MRESKRQLGKPKCSWEGSINIYLGEIGLAGVDWFNLAQEV
jgi:hypothetical protein